MSSSFKKSLFRRIKERNNHFFSTIRIAREQDNFKKRSEYSWKGMNYKIYPSGLQSFTMCPKRYVEEDVHKPANFTIDQIYRMAVGTSLHSMFQGECLTLNNFLYARPDLTNFKSLYKVEDIDLETKLNSNWPEIPVYHKSGLSGRADLVLNINSSPLVFDIKTTYVEKDRWQSGYKEKLPYDSHIVQVSIYIYLMNLYQFYNKKIVKGSLGYVNIAMAPGEEDSEYEVYFDYTEEIENKVGALIEHLEKHKLAFLSDETIDCQYPYCKAHRKLHDTEQILV